MSMPQSENRKKAFEVYEQNNGDIPNRTIAEQLGINEKTVGGWKCKDKWDERLSGVLRKTKRSTPEEKKQGRVPKYPFQKGNKLAVGHGAPKGNKNALGNRGGHGAPKGNKQTEKHGFFAKIFPDDEETRSIIQHIQIKSPLDILWENIVIQYTAIARAQKIMHVKSQDDLTKHLKRQKESSGLHSDSWEKEWEIQYAWDKHANFLQAQSRAITTLERLIDRYEKLLLKDMETEEQQLRIETLKAQLDKIKNPNQEADITKYIEALHQTAEDVWSGEEEEDKEADGEGEADA